MGIEIYQRISQIKSGLVTSALIHTYAISYILSNSKPNGTKHNPQKTTLQDLLQLQK